MKNIYKFLIIIVTVLFFGILSIYFIPSHKNFVVFKIKQKIPSSIKTKLKDTLFIIPEQKRKIEFYQKKYNNLEVEYKLLRDELIKIKSKEINNFNLKKIKIPFYNRETSQKSVGFIEFYNSKLITISGTGKFLYSNQPHIASEIKFNEIKTNLNELILDKNFFDSEQREEMGEMISIKDTLVIKDKIYISYSKLINKDKNCYNISILEANFNFTKLNFKNFFDKLSCIEKPDGYHTGGRMVYVKEDNSIILTTGDMGAPILAQEEKSYYGKILKINLKNLKIEILSKGHRNPQGLAYDERTNLVFSTEHGPIGGDEVNLIRKGKNYGWPLASYGESDLEHLKSHKLHNFIEPLIYFTPAIGISEILYVYNESSNLHDKFILTSLKGNHNGGQIYILKFLEYENKMEILNQISIGERIRDIKYLPKTNTIYLALEDTPALGILEFKQ